MGEMFRKYEDAMNALDEKKGEVKRLKNSRLEKEDEVDRLKILLTAQEQRNAEQLVTVDKYQASVANHDAEMRQMHALLECEREECIRQLKEMEQIQGAARQAADRRVER